MREKKKTILMKVFYILLKMFTMQLKTLRTILSSCTWCIFMKICIAFIIFFKVCNINSLRASCLNLVIWLRTTYTIFLFFSFYLISFPPTKCLSIINLILNFYHCFCNYILIWPFLYSFLPIQFLFPCFTAFIHLSVKQFIFCIFNQQK